MKNKTLLFQVSIIATAAIVISFVIHMYLPYFGLWDESKIFENRDKYEIISKSNQLKEVQLFLEKYPDAETKVNWEQGQLSYIKEKTIKTESGDEKRRLVMQVQFDAFASPSPYIIGCSGSHNVVGGFDNIMEKLQSDWCFTGGLISMPDGEVIHYSDESELAEIKKRITDQSFKP